ncbi:MAG TPA: hypothetical protein VGF86_07375 [Candidatus Tumulicola sp.]|jgi:hypothetical protein
MDHRTDVNRYLTIFALSAPSAVAIWWIFHGVYAGLTQTESAMGYVDSTTQMGIYLGYVAMVGGTLAFGAIAAWAAWRATQAWMRARSRK